MLRRARMVFAGFAAGDLRTRIVEAPVLGRIVIAPMTGFIESGRGPAGGQAPPGAARGPARCRRGDRPRLVRVTVRSGDRLRGRAIHQRRERAPAAAAAAGLARRLRFRPRRLLPRDRRGRLRSRARDDARPAASRHPWTLRIAAAVDEARNALTRAHRLRHRRRGRRCRRGARHRQARPHSEADQRRAARRGHLPHRVDLGPAHGARRRDVLLARARAPEPRAGACPALAGEEDRGRHRDGRRDRLLRLLRLGRRDRALAHHDAGDVRRGAGRTVRP